MLRRQCILRTVSQKYMLKDGMTFALWIIKRHIMGKYILKAVAPFFAISGMVFNIASAQNITDGNAYGPRCFSKKIIICNGDTLQNESKATVIYGNGKDTKCITVLNNCGNCEIISNDGNIVSDSSMLKDLAGLTEDISGIKCIINGALDGEFDCFGNGCPLSAIKILKEENGNQAVSFIYGIQCDECAHAQRPNGAIRERNERRNPIPTCGNTPDRVKNSIGGKGPGMSPEKVPARVAEDPVPGNSEFPPCMHHKAANPRHRHHAARPERPRHGDCLLSEIHPFFNGLGKEIREGRMLFVVNGKKSDYESFKHNPPHTIKSIEISKDPKLLKKYKAEEGTAIMLLTTF